MISSQKIEDFASWKMISNDVVVRKRNWTNVNIREGIVKVMRTRSVNMYIAEAMIYVTLHPRFGPNRFPSPCKIHSRFGRLLLLIMLLEYTRLYEGVC